MGKEDIKRLVDIQKNKLKKDMEELKREREQLDMEMHATTLIEKDLENKVAEATKLVEQAKKDKQQAQSEVQSISKELNKMIQEQKKGFTTPMFEKPNK